jgi:hypothetical protein
MGFDTYQFFVLCPTPCAYLFFDVALFFITHQMNSSVFIERLSEQRKCTKSSANTHFLTIKRIFRMVKGWDRLRPVEKIPKTSAWLTKSFFTKIKDLTPLVQRNLLVSAVVYLQFTKAPKTKIKEFTTKMYDLVKEIRQQRKKSGFALNEKQKKMWVGKTALNEKWNCTTTL